MARQTTPPKFYTVDDLADILQITTRSVRNYILKGDLVAHRLRGSRLIRIRAEDFEAFLGSPIEGAA